MFFATKARRLLENGYAVIPLVKQTKRPAVSNWPAFCRRAPSVAQIDRWMRRYGDGGVGICAGSVIGVDIDILDLELAEAAATIVRAHVPGALERVGQAPKRLFLCRALEPCRSRKVGYEVDILAAGRQFVAFGVHPATNREYIWTTKSPLDVPLANLPAIGAAALDALAGELAALQGVTTASAPSHTPHEEPITRSLAGLVLDGRDVHLRDLIWRHIQSSDDPEAIARKAWADFQRTADLRRPKRDGTESWTFNDALEKAVYALRRKYMPPTKPPRQFRWSVENKALFERAVYKLAATGAISRAAVKLSDAMLSFVRGNEMCCASVKTLARLAGLQPDTVKAARRTLVEAELWLPLDNKGGRYRSAAYAPNFAVIAPPRR